MIRTTELITKLSEHYSINEISIPNNSFQLFSFGKEKDKNYIIIKNDLSAADDLQNIKILVDSLTEKKFKFASYIYITFVNADFNDFDYIAFNGNSFLHTVVYHIGTMTFKYDKNFHYCGCKNIKQFFNGIESLLNEVFV